MRTEDPVCPNFLLTLGRKNIKVKQNCHGQVCKVKWGLALGAAETDVEGRSGWLGKPLPGPQRQLGRREFGDGVQGRG